MTGAIPLWLQIGATVYVAVLVPVYWAQYGPRNFLWFSDIALGTMLVALWLESSLLASMMVLAIGLPELLWNVDFLGCMVTRRRLLGMADYMFDRTIPGAVRFLSLFHVWMPLVLLWMVHRLGYDRRAWAYQSLVALVVFPLTRALTGPGDNINWVYGPGGAPQRRLPGWLYVAFLMVFFPVVVYSVTHLLVRALF